MKWVRKRVKMAPRSDREIRNIWTDPLKCCNIRISVKVCNHVRQKGKGNRNVWIFDIRNDACAYRSGCEKRDRSQTRWRIPENRERIRWPDPPPQKPQSGLFLRIHEGIPKTCGDGPGLHAVGAWAYVIGKKGRVLEKTALTLVLAGGASNLYDRLKRGYVVDYFSIQWKKLKKVVFNLGDIFIFAGSALFAAVQLLEEIREILPKEKIFVKEEE